MSSIWQPGPGGSRSSLDQTKTSPTQSVNMLLRYQRLLHKTLVHYIKEKMIMRIENGIVLLYVS